MDPLPHPEPDTPRRGVMLAITVVLVAGVLAFLLIGCDNTARTDLPQGSQSNDATEAVIALFPDGFPNVAHKCVDFGGVGPIGIFTTTDRFVILVYNDHACPGANLEQPIEVVNMGARSAVSSG